MAMWWHTVHGRVDATWISYLIHVRATCSLQRFMHTWATKPSPCGLFKYCLFRFTWVGIVDVIGGIDIFIRMQNMRAFEQKWIWKFDSITTMEFALIFTYNYSSIWRRGEIRISKRFGSIEGKKEKNRRKFSILLKIEIVRRCWLCVSVYTIRCFDSSQPSSVTACK